jgi:hypothetical protein
VARFSKWERRRCYGCSFGWFRGCECGCLVNFIINHITNTHLFGWKSNAIFEI